MCNIDSSKLTSAAVHSTFHISLVELVSNVVVGPDQEKASFILISSVLTGNWLYREKRFYINYSSTVSSFLYPQTLANVYANDCMTVSLF